MIKNIKTIAVVVLIALCLTYLSPMLLSTTPITNRIIFRPGQDDETDIGMCTGKINSIIIDKTNVLTITSESTVKVEIPSNGSLGIVEIRSTGCYLRVICTPLEGGVYFEKFMTLNTPPTIKNNDPIKEVTTTHIAAVSIPDSAWGLKGITVKATLIFESEMGHFTEYGLDYYWAYYPLPDYTLAHGGEIVVKQSTQPPVKGLTVYVKDISEAPVGGAMVTNTGAPTTYTDLTGKAGFIMNVPSGTYKITITKSGFITEETTVTFSESDTLKSIVVIMTKPGEEPIIEPPITDPPARSCEWIIIVKDTSYSGELLPGASVTVNGETKTTGDDGSVTFTVSPTSQMATVKKSGYTTLTETTRFSAAGMTGTSVVPLTRDGSINVDVGDDITSDLTPIIILLVSIGLIAVGFIFQVFGNYKWIIILIGIFGIIYTVLTLGWV